MYHIYNILSSSLHFLISYPISSTLLAILSDLIASISTASILNFNLYGVLQVSAPSVSELLFIVLKICKSIFGYFFTLEEILHPTYILFGLSSKIQKIECFIPDCFFETYFLSKTSRSQIKLKSHLDEVENE